MEISVIESSCEPIGPSKDSFKKRRCPVSCVSPLPFLYQSITKLFALLLIYGTVWGLLENEALPGSNVFAILLLVVCAQVGGELAELIKLPSLLGMLIVGFLYRNLPFISFYDDISPKWASAFRNGALAIIMLRAGLSLDPSVLKHLSCACFRLSILPCSFEAVSIGVVAYYILGFPVSLAFCLGFVVAAVSPAVVIPSMFSLDEKGYGREKGIMTLVVAATAIENVYAIAIFGILVGIEFAKGSLVWKIIKGPLAVVVGIVYGAVIGVLCWNFPVKNENYKMLYRVILLTFAGLAVTFVSQVLDFAAAGPLGCLSVAFVAALKWREEDDKNVFVSDFENGTWIILQTFLFALIGVEVSLDDIKENIAFGVLVIVIGIIFRLLVAFLSVFRTGLNMREKLFITFAWLPKATVQAAIGSVALDLAKAANLGPEYISYGKQILTIAALSILFTAPIGAILMAVLGPIFLQKCDKLEEEEKTPEPTTSVHHSYGTLSTNLEKEKNFKCNTI